VTVLDPGVTVYPGEAGAFAEEAARTIGPGTLEPIGLAGFREVFTTVSAGAAPRPDGPDMPVAAGVLPIENVLGGTVRETYDLLLEFELEIVGEVIVPVHLCLAALPGQRLDQVDRVYSHVQALAQAEHFLRTRPWTLLTTYNTAAAARMVAERVERGAAAVVSPRAASLYGLEVLATAIEDTPDDRTRFLVVARPAGGSPASRAGRARTSSGSMRTTLVLGLANEPGSLVRALRVLADGGLNMSKLESRPLPGRAWQYVFWIDLDADAGEPAVAATLERLRVVVSFLRVLGSYPRAVTA
jgi:prephenate dehydratase